MKLLIFITFESKLMTEVALICPENKSKLVAISLLPKFTMALEGEAWTLSINASVVLTFNWEGNFWVVPLPWKSIAISA